MDAHLEHALPGTASPRCGDSPSRPDDDTRRLEVHGAPRIHAELTKLGFIVSEVTVSRYMPRRPAEPDQVKRWVAFLRNHKDESICLPLTLG